MHFFLKNMSVCVVHAFLREIVCQTLLCTFMTHFLCEPMSDIIVQANDAILM